jgi:hypothetical protein
VDLAPLRAERGELPSKQGAFERRRLLSKGSVEKTAGFFQVAERSVELGVRREPVGVAREQIAFGDRVELVETDAGPAHRTMAMARARFTSTMGEGDISRSTS